MKGNEGDLYPLIHKSFRQVLSGVNGDNIITLLYQRGCGKAACPERYVPLGRHAPHQDTDLLHCNHVPTILTSNSRVAPVSLSTFFPIRLIREMTSPAVAFPLFIIKFA